LQLGRSVEFDFPLPGEMPMLPNGTAAVPGIAGRDGAAVARVAQVATGVLVQRRLHARHPEVLMLRKTGGGWPGHWVFPGGRLQHGETFVAGACRELEEETGIKLSPATDPIRLVAVTSVVSPELHLVGFLFEVRDHFPESRAVNAEPEKHDEIGWFPWTELPRPLMPGVAAYVAARLGSQDAYGPLLLGDGRWASCTLFRGRIV
jgi:8-oxo-dGTP diphosphatase